MLATLVAVDEVGVAEAAVVARVVDRDDFANPLHTAASLPLNIRRAPGFLGRAPVCLA